MGPMDGPPEPGDRAPAGRLERPPGERYAPTPPGPDAPERPASPGRGLAYAASAGAAGSALTVALAGLFAVSLGLLVVALLTGRLVADGLRAGARDTIAGERRRAVATTIAVAAVAAAQVGIWLYARSEGGSLGLADYLGQTFGWLVPAQVVLAGVAAAYSAR
jgi:hypothetical protein